jgi:hypothetical protein
MPSQRLDCGTAHLRIVIRKISQQNVTERWQYSLTLTRRAQPMNTDKRIGIATHDDRAKPMKYPQGMRLLDG